MSSRSSRNASSPIANWRGTSALPSSSGDPAFPSPSWLLTVLGTGGTGKTRLAQRYGWESLVRWPGGAWFCDLSDVRSIDGIVNAAATSLDVPLSKEDPIAQLGHAIAGRGRALFVLDNFEQVAEQRLQPPASGSSGVRRRAFS